MDEGSYPAMTIPPTSPKVLIVDDDPLSRRLMQVHLGRAGFTVLEATSGQEGIKAAFCELPRVIIMDVIMPDMDGLTVVRELKKVPATKNIPIVVITASVQVHDAYRRECEMFGAAEFLTKPIAPAQLITQIKRLAGS